jgi:hypothetical protein
MVLVAFTLPSYDVVFKLIKDRFDHPKNPSRSEVMRKYRLFFEHDRAGRLVEAFEFEHLRSPRNRSRAVLIAQELYDPDYGRQQAAGVSVSPHDRRQSTPGAASASGQTGKSPIFPGDAQFWYEIQRAFGAAEYGGSSIQPAILPKALVTKKCSGSQRQLFAP